MSNLDEEVIEEVLFALRLAYAHLLGFRCITGKSNEWTDNDENAFLKVGEAIFTLKEVLSEEEKLMTTLDIRKDPDTDREIKKIFFADEGVCYIQKGNFNYVCLEEPTMYIASKEHAQNLIKAINKAIELGWLK